MIKDAVISDDGKYRYQLSRVWDYTKLRVMFIMLNPSTADAERDDPTIRRCIGFAKSWGYGGIYVGNIYAYRATEPEDLLLIKDPVGPDNLEHLDIMAKSCDKVICAWGNAKIIKKLGDFDITIEFQPYYLELTKGGTPKHPLYLRGDLKPKIWESDGI